MVVWSGFLRPTGQILLRGSRILPKNLQQNVSGTIQNRLMSEHRLMPIQPSRWQWHKTKDLFHLYFMVGAIPCISVILLSQIFVGPAELQEIPEGYEPKHWEYYRDPISRFIARYMYNSPQMEYEKYLHCLWAESEVMKLRKLERQVDDIMYQRKDYQAYYYQPYAAKYTRQGHYQEHEKAEYAKGR